MSYYKKLLLTSLSVCIAFSVILSVTVFSLYYSNTYKSFEAKAKKFTEKASDNFDEMLLIAKNTGTILKYSNDITEYVQNPNPIPYTIIKCREYLNNTVFSLESKCFMMVLSKIYDNFVLSSSTMDLDYYCSITEIDKGSILSFYNSSINSEKAMTSKFITSSIDGKQALTFLKLQKYENNKGCTLLSTYMLDSLIDISDMKYGTLIFFVNNSPVVSYGTLNFDDASKCLESGSKGYTVYTVYGKANDVAGDVKCVFLLNNSMLNRSIISEMLWVFPICLLFLLASVYVMYLITKRNYLPVKSTIDTLKEFGKVNSKSEFDFINSTIHDLSEKNQTLKEILKTSSLSLEKKFFRELSFGILSEREISDFFAEYPKLFTPGKYLFTVISYNKYFELEKSLSSEALSKIKKTVTKNIENFFPDAGFILVFDIDHMSHGIILQVKDVSVIESKFRSFIIQFETNYSIELYAAVGTSVSNIKAIRKSYISAKKLYDNVMFASSQNLVYTEENFRRSNSEMFIYPVDLESALIESTVQCNNSSTFSIIDRIFDACFTQCDFTPNTFAHLIFMLTATLNRTLATVNKSVSEIFGPDINIFLELKMQKEPLELNEKLKSMYKKIIDSTEETMNLEGKRSAEFMLSFIYDNYMYDISLVDLSDKLNMSQNYAGRLFKKLTNTNFKEYLMRYRFTKAKEIMSGNKNIKMKDIAALVGCNSEILTRIFLKYAGTTPSEFRETL